MIAGQCTLPCCVTQRDEQLARNARRGVHPFPPAGAAPVASVGATTPDEERSAGYPTGHGVRQGLADAVAAQLPPQSSSAVAGAPEPRCDGLGSQAALDTFPGPVVPGAGAPASTTRVQPRAVEPRLVFPSERMKRIDGFFDDCFYAGGWGFLALAVVAVLWAVTR